MAGKSRSGRTLAGQAASGLTAVTGHMKPLASGARAAATRGVQTARTWSAPRVERTGQVLQGSVAPKIASLLSSAAQRLDPGKPRHARWSRPAGIATVAAAASAAMAVVLRRRKPGAGSSRARQDGLAPAAEMPDNLATTSADVEGQVGTS